MMNQTNTAPLIVELLTEELPPKALKQLSQSFATTIFDALSKQQLLEKDASAQTFATPRRLAVYIDAVRSQAPEQQLSSKLLPVHIALDAQGQATQALQKKLHALGFADYTVDQLEKRQEGKHEVFYLQYRAAGVDLQNGLQMALDKAIKQMPIPKVMTYQNTSGEDIQFVRPVKNLLALHGKTVVPITAFGLHANQHTQGHRFLCKTNPLNIENAQEYATHLQTQGHVIANFDQRKALIKKALLEQAGNNVVVMPDSLVDEVTALVEWPAIYTCHFDPEFLDVPQECLILTMQTNQKYFALTNQQQQLLPQFLIVSNIDTATPQDIIKGNERVIRPRLADAQFFFHQDKKIPLAKRVPLLEKVIYHNQLGNQQQRTQRLMEISEKIAHLLNMNVTLAKRAAYLAKADLVTEMVGEFPELQGIMGAYYAKHDQEPEAVTLSCKEHYQPRFSGDALPSQGISTIVALADKLETLVGIWGIGLVPTGEKDPFGLRRHALGILRILIEQRLALNLYELLEITFQSFKEVPAVKDQHADLIHFLMDRLRGLLRDKNYSFQEVEAVISQTNGQLDELFARLEAVRVFSKLSEAQALASANKRIGNILKKSEYSSENTLNPSLLSEPAEKELYNQLMVLAPKVQQYVKQAEYEQALIALATLQKPVDCFFNDVMVNVDDVSIKNNRLALLNELHQSMNLVADISKLAV